MINLNLVSSAAGGDVGTQNSTLTSYLWEKKDMMRMQKKGEVLVKFCGFGG